MNIWAYISEDNLLELVPYFHFVRLRDQIHRVRIGSSSLYLLSQAFIKFFLFLNSYFITLCMDILSARMSVHLT